MLFRKFAFSCAKHFFVMMNLTIPLLTYLFSVFYIFFNNFQLTNCFALGGGIIVSCATFFSQDSPWRD